MIKVKNLTKEFRSGRGVVKALSSVDIEISAGASAAIFGKSGSGKTTLLNCIGGLEQPEKGTVECFGKDIHALNQKELSLFQRKNLGFVFQRSNLLGHLTVFENIAFPLILNDIDKTELLTRVDGLLRRIGLKDAAKAMPHELSGGELQRVAVARAVAHGPVLLLADEPTASLDTATGKALVEMMFELCRERNCTMLVSTHDPELIKLTGINIRLVDGRVV